MREGLLAGFQYWGAIFALGFVLGAVRQTLLAPAIGAFWATAMELPLILSASWWWSTRLVRKRAWPAGARERWIMGISAFVLLMLAELLLDFTIGQRDPVAFVRAWLQPAGVLGLAGQVLFAVFPIWVERGHGHLLR
jgi:hypothetical protein